jgi:protein-tyrosine phosphatase
VDFIDIHSHVLYGLDDGPRDAAGSRALLEMAARGGTTDIVATPHANSKYRFNPALIEARVAELQPGSAVRIHRGCDFRLQADTIDDALANPAKYTINHGRYLLVEFPDMTVFAHADAVLLRLLDADLVPIVTHPERHPVLSRQIEDLARWVQMGCFVQVTAGSITGRFGRSAQASVRRFVERGVVHFVASDAHDTRHRPQTLGDAYDQLAREWDEDVVRPMFVDYPRAVVVDEAIETDLRVRRKKRWYQFWGGS